MTGDFRDDLAAMDLSMIAFALAPALFVGILTVMSVWLYFSQFRFVLFFNTKLKLDANFGVIRFIVPFFKLNHLTVFLRICSAL